MAQTIPFTTAQDQKTTWQEWHERWGHISHTTLKRIKDKNLVEGFDVYGNFDNFECEACAAAKQSRRPFPQKADNRVNRPGELTHTDVWGPARNPMATGARFFMTFIDDYTRRSVVKFQGVSDWTTEKSTATKRHCREV